MHNLFLVITLFVLGGLLGHFTYDIVFPKE